MIAVILCRKMARVQCGFRLHPAPCRKWGAADCGINPERKMETTKDTKVHENQRVENLTALIFRVWMGLPSNG
jgi:hypothetical protein